MKHLTPNQIKRVNVLVRSMCANCDSEGRCRLHPIELNKKGEYEHWGCPQLISYHLLCRYFEKSILPGDDLLYAEIMKENTKSCEKCKKPFVPKSNRAKYCSECAAREIKKADRLRKQKKNQDKP